jgi:RNA polymerase sigma factor (TIGR02999 family)
MAEGLADFPAGCSPADLSIIYEELRTIARSQLSKERPNHTFQPTALVHEVYLRLANQTGIQDRDKLLALASRVMRHVLVDYARHRSAIKRTDFRCRVELSEDNAPAAPDADLLVLEEAMKDLEKMDARQARIVELRVFAGLTIDEIAALLNISARTVKRDWVMARAWLQGRLRHSSS